VRKYSDETALFNANDCPRDADGVAGVFEPYSIHVMQRLLRSGTAVFLDVGAHVGMYSWVAAATPTSHQVRIIAFEPNPFAFTRLSLHVRVNGWHQRIGLNPFGLSRVSGVQFYDWVDKGPGWISSGGVSGDQALAEGRCRLVAVSQVLEKWQVPCRPDPA
jgi:FkbM family methyltransferase